MNGDPEIALQIAERRRELQTLQQAASAWLHAHVPPGTLHSAGTAYETPPGIVRIRPPIVAGVAAVVGGGRISIRRAVATDTAPGSAAAPVAPVLASHSGATPTNGYRVSPVKLEQVKEESEAQDGAGVVEPTADVVESHTVPVPYPQCGWRNRGSPQKGIASTLHTCMFQRFLRTRITWA